MYPTSIALTMHRFFPAAVGIVITSVTSVAFTVIITFPWKLERVTAPTLAIRPIITAIPVFPPLFFCFELRRLIALVKVPSSFLKLKRCFIAVCLFTPLHRSSTARVGAIAVNLKNAKRANTNRIGPLPSIRLNIALFSPIKDNTRGIPRFSILTARLLPGPPGFLDIEIFVLRNSSHCVNCC